MSMRSHPLGCFGILVHHLLGYSQKPAAQHPLSVSCSLDTFHYLLYVLLLSMPLYLPICLLGCHKPGIRRARSFVKIEKAR
jgi:hypothetical protein